MTVSKYSLTDHQIYCQSLDWHNPSRLVSEAWGGRTSDKFLTENCGFLNNLVSGDLVLADRGFTVHKEVWFRQVELNIPAFTQGKNQLVPLDVEKT